MRPETEKVYADANYAERLLIALYVRDGWDQYWPYNNRPMWLVDRYNGAVNPKWGTSPAEQIRDIQGHVERVVADIGKYGKSQRTE